MGRVLLLVWFAVDLGRRAFGLCVVELWKNLDYENVYMHTKSHTKVFGMRSEINRLPCLDLSETSPLAIWGVAAASR